MSLHQSCEHRRSLQYVDVSVGSRYSEERMTNPHVVIGDSFKNHTAFPIAAFVQPLPSKRAIISRLFHGINATKHPRKSSRCILCKDSGCVFFIWLLQISWTKHCNNCPTKLEDTICKCRKKVLAMTTQKVGREKLRVLPIE
jgi:hypothetical protein